MTVASSRPAESESRPPPESEPSSGTTRLSLLGGFRLECGGRAVALQPGSQRLVALLALQGRLTRAAAARILWPDAREGQAHARMRSTLWRLGSCPAVRLVGRLLMVPGEVTVDLRPRVDAATRLIERRTPEPGDVEVLHSGSGELLPCWYDDWVLVERERYRQLRLRALEALAEVECDRGRYPIAVDAALAVVRMEPLCESAHHTLVRAFLGEHNLVEAARHYRTVKAVLAAELGIEPAPELTALLAAHGLL
jgi:DNA-binding SARP family transcriptional activator